MPELARILIYPVKALEPVSLQEVRVLPTGALEGDRAFGMFDAAGKFINGKRNAKVHHLRSSFDAPARLLTLSGADRRREVVFHVDRERPLIEAWLSGFFEQPITFLHNGELGFPDDLDCPGPTVISTATLAEVARWFAPLDVAQMRLRFRANLELDGACAFWEDRLYSVKGSRVRFRIGDCVLDGNNPCQRCAVPPRDPHTGQNDPHFVKKFSELREQTLPSWAERSRFNHFYRLSVNTLLVPDHAGRVLRVGDPVEVMGVV